jgi:hypothetical protein
MKKEETVMGRVAFFGCMAVCLVASLVAEAQAQTQSRAREFMQKVIGFGAADIQAVDAGKVVTRLLETGEKAEVAAFGAVRVKAQPAALFEAAKDIREFRKVPEILQIGVFSDPPRVEDLAGLTFPEEDIDALRKCRPGKCDVKLGTAFIDRLAREVDWKQDGAREKAASIAKQALVEGLRVYQASGTEAMGVVVDKSDPKSRAAEFDTLLANSPYFLEYVPDFFDHLRDYPKGEDPEIRDVFYWTKDGFGLKEVVSVYHVSVLRRGDQALLAQKTLYASHYFNAGLEVWSVAPPASGSGFDLLMLYRTRLDPPTGMLAGMLMGKVRGGVEEGVRANLENARAKSEGR